MSSSLTNEQFELTLPLLTVGSSGTDTTITKSRTQQRISLTTKRRKMSRRANLIGVCGVCSLCILLLIATTQHHPLTLTASLVSSSGAPSGRAKTQLANLAVSTELTDERTNTATNSFPAAAYQTQIDYNLTATIQDVLAAQRARIYKEMENFEYPNGQFNVEAKQLSDLTTETNGTPIRSLILTTWRSGSTFLGDILNAIPGNYYHYEPLLDFGIVRVRAESSNGQLAIRNLLNLVNCNYTHMRNYLEYGKEHTNLFEHNERLWSVCKEFPHYCWQSKFLTPFCRLFPMQSMKSVRISLSLGEQLLQTHSLNVRIVLLVRDPRGTMQSRKHRTWCAGNPDCEEPRLLCKDLVDDYNTAKKLLDKYPDRFKTLRYEDLSLNPYEISQEILQFYGLPFDPMVEEFLNTHTKVNIGGVSSTYRDSKSAPFHWKQDLRIEEIKYIQDQCTEAMQLWGYRPIEDFKNFQNTFDPIILPPPFD